MKPHYIRDREINLEEDGGDLLGTQPYVRTLLEIINETDTPFTIGLFGGWGTGKSSIVRTIKEKLNSDQLSGSRVFVYDAWKYSEDPFRRTFISQFKDDFGIKGTSELDSFYADKNEEIRAKTGVVENWWINLAIFIAPIIILIGIPMSIGNEFELTTFIISLFLSAIAFFISKTYVRYKISIIKPKTFAPEQFEDIFTEFVKNAVGQQSAWKYVKRLFVPEKEISKIVIVVDNIDRCHKNLAFELLLTVKNFLEQENVVFVIPIDETELKKHIKKEGHDGNEFLRKLFGTTLTIKKFSEDDLFDFTKSLQKKHSLDLSDDVLSLISQEFSRSPRKIIQFLNVLQTEIRLAEEQETTISNNRSNFAKGVITENIEFLVKILLIREEWTRLYERVNENPFILEDIYNQIDHGKQQIAFGSDTENERLVLTDEQRRFLESTRDISTRNVEAFFSNRDSFPGIPDDVPGFVLSQDWETIKIKYISKDILDFEALLSFVDNLFKRDVTRRNLMKRSGLNIISFIFKISEDHEYREPLLTSYYGKSKTLSALKSKLNSKAISELVLRFNHSRLLNFVGTDLDRNAGLLGAIINVIENGENEANGRDDLTKKFVRKFKDNSELLKKISGRFSTLIAEDPDQFNDFEKILDNSKVSGALIRPSLLENFVEGLEFDQTSEGVSTKTKILRHYHRSKGLSPELLKQYVEKIRDFLNSIDDFETTSFWLKQVIPFIGSISDHDQLEELLDGLEQKYTFLWQQYDPQWANELYRQAVFVFAEASAELYIQTEANESKIISWINDFFKKNESVELATNINQLYIKLVGHFPVFTWTFSTLAINKFDQISKWNEKKKIAKTLNLMLLKTSEEKGLSKAQITTILNSYIANISSETEVVKSWLSDAIDNSLVKTQLTEIVKDLGIDGKLDLLEIIKELDKELVRTCVEEIVSETGVDELEDHFEKLDKSGVGRGPINKGILKKVRSIQKSDDEDYFERFLRLVTERKLTKAIKLEVVSKISPLLHDIKTKEEKVLALQVLNTIEIPSDKKTLLEALLRDLETSEFDGEEKSLFARVIEQTSI